MFSSVAGTLAAAAGSTSCSMVVPETPEATMAGRRRSSRRSTMFSSAATDSLRRQQRVNETPEERRPGSTSAAGGKRQTRRRTVMVAESPDTEVQSSKFVSRLPPDGHTPETGPRTAHPLFNVDKLVNNRDLEGEETFVQYVAATQDLASTQIESGNERVKRWLNRNDDGDSVAKEEEETSNASEDMSLTLAAGGARSRRRPSDSARRRRSTHIGPKELCQVLLEKEGKSKDDPSPPTQRTPSFTPSRRKSSIMLQPLAADSESPAAVQYFKGPLTLSPKRRPRPSTFVSDASPTKGTNTSPSKFSARTNSNDSGVRRAVRKSVANIIDRLDEEDEGGQEPADDRPVPQAGNSFTDFSTDSAKALMKHYEMLSSQKKAGNEEGSNEKSDPQSPLPGPSNAAEEREEPDTSPITNPLTILSAVTAFVEVRTQHENRSRCVQDQLTALGATIAPKLTKEVTHVVFKDGGLATYNRAKKLGAHIVSVTWIEACKKEGRLVDESLFPTVSKAKYDSPNLFPKLRKAKSMQPKDEEERLKQVEAVLKRKKKANQKKKPGNDPADANSSLNSSGGPTGSTASTKFHVRRVPLDFYNSPKLEEERRKKLQSKKEYAEKIMDVINQMEDAEDDAGGEELCSSQSSLSSEDFNTPLAERLVNKVKKLNRSSLGPKSGGGGSKRKSNAHDLDPESEVSLHVGHEVEEEPLFNDVSGVAAMSSPVAPPREQPEERPPIKRRLIITDEVTNCDGGGGDSSEHQDEEQAETAMIKERNAEAAVVEGKSRRAKSRARDSLEKVKKHPVRRGRNHRPLFSQKAADHVLEVTPANTPAKPLVPVVNVHARETKKKPPGKKKKKCTRSKREKAKSEKKFALPTAARLQPPRRSSLEFIDSKSSSAAAPRAKPKAGIEPHQIVCTSCEKDDVDLVRQLASKIEGSALCASDDGKVSPGLTSHVVCGENRRTINLLKGILLGCWVVSRDWLLASLEAGRWVEEEPHEVTDFSAAAKKNREERQAFGWQHYRCRLFQDCGAIYVDKRRTVAPAADISRLVQLAGGKTVKLARLAQVIVTGNKGRGENGLRREEQQGVCVDEKWVFDSIQRDCVLPLPDYALPNSAPHCSV